MRSEKWQNPGDFHTEENGRDPETCAASSPFRERQAASRCSRSGSLGSSRRPAFIAPPAFQYADPVADLLDRWGVFRARLFRESCVFHRGNYVKDLSRLGRELSKVIIVDNSPASYIFHPENAVSASRSRRAPSELGHICACRHLGQAARPLPWRNPSCATR